MAPQLVGIHHNNDAIELGSYDGKSVGKCIFFESHSSSTIIYRRGYGAYIIRDRYVT